MSTIMEEQIKLISLAKTPADLILIQKAVKAIQEITIDEIYNNFHRNDKLETTPF